MGELQTSGLAPIPEAVATVAWLRHKKTEAGAGSRERKVAETMLEWWEGELARLTGRTAQIIQFPQMRP